MTPFDGSYTTFYRLAIVSIALYAVPFSSYLTLNNHDLEIWVTDHGTDRRSSKLVPFESLGIVYFAFHSNYGRIFRSFTTFYWSTIVNIDLSCTVFELSDVE